VSRAFGSATPAGLLCLWRWRCLRLTSERPHCIEERFSDDAPVAKKRLRVGGLSGRALVVLVKLTSKVKGSGGARKPRRHSKEEVRPHAVDIMSTNRPGNPVPGRCFTKAPQSPQSTRRDRRYHLPCRASPHERRGLGKAGGDVRSARKDSLFANVLLACALAETDELGFLAAQDVRAPLRVITGEQYDIPTYAQHLNEYSDAKRGPVLHRIGHKRRYRCRFTTPLMQPFVIMNGFLTGRVDRTLVDRLPSR